MLSDVAIQVEKPDKNGNVVKIEKSTFQAGTGTQGLYCQAVFPAGFQSSITYQYWYNGKSADGAVIITPNVRAAFLKDSSAKFGRSYRFLSNSRFEIVDEPGNALVFGPMKRLVALGSVETRSVAKPATLSAHDILQMHHNRKHNTRR